MRFIKKSIRAVILLLLVFVVWEAYVLFVAPTRIAIVSFPGFMTEKMERANTNSWVKLDALELSELDQLDKYPLALVRGHGIRISAEQLSFIRKAMDQGTKVYVADVTNPEYDLTNIQGKELDYISELMENKGARNYRSLFNYSRTIIDGKQVFLEPYDDAVIIPDDFLFHLDEDLTFAEVKEYEKYYREKGLYKEGRPRVALLAGNINMQNSNAEHTVKFINSLEKENLNVYPISSFGIKKLEILEQIKPDVVLLRPHGRMVMGAKDKAVAWLKEHNVPVLTPITVFGEYEQWLTDPQGMYGGMMSMSVVMPELDGAVAPYAVVAQYKTESGNLIFDGIDNRVESISKMAAQWANLRFANNKDKKVAIYYFKGPGKNAMVASGLEVIPSLYTVLKRLQKEGYNVDGLPATKEAFKELLMKKGPVLGPYAHGAFSDYLQHGDPVLVEKDKYEAWCRKAMPQDLYQSVVDIYGPAPGEYMSVDKEGKDYIAVTCVKFGNVCLLPQPLPGIGDDTQQLVHGAKTAPPHTYIASYLWTRFGFNVDAIFHFGTHGSLEFTPGKQVALSDYDWADRLIGTTPHFYNYTINNIGEGIIAKRRTYATLLTYLTPPFMKSGLNKDLEALHNKMDKYNSLPGGPVREQYAISVKELVEKLNIHKALNLDSTKRFTNDDVHQVHEYLEEIEQEKVTAGLYTLGVPYTDDKLNNSARLMSLDQIAFSMAELDYLKKKISLQQYQDAMFVSKRYRPVAQRIVNRLLNGAKAQPELSRLISVKELERAHQWEIDNKDVDLMALMMSRAGSKKMKSQSVDESKLPSLIVKLCSDEKNKAYIERLKSDKTFAKSSRMLDEAKRKKAIKMAEKMKRIAPEMYEAVSIVKQPDMLALLALMQDSLLRIKTFELINDENLAQKIEEKHIESLKEKARKCDDEKTVEWITLAMANKVDGKVQNASLEELNKGSSLLEFVQKNTECLSYCKHKIFTSQKAKKDSWNNSIAQAIKDITDAVAIKEKSVARYAKTVLKLEEAILNVQKNKNNLAISSEKELMSIINALNGGYTAPSSGGDPIVNPAALPTGRNMYSVDAERTPSDEAWEVGKRLARSLLAKELELKGHYPKKVSFTLWSSNFISTEGATIAQILYLLGVEPVRDGFGTVRNLRIIPMEQLNRPRVDVLIQTSGQLRDIAASRLDLINKAVMLAAEANDNDSLNFVKRGLVNAEKFLLEKGYSPLDARKFSAKRIFGGVNGNYGTGITGLVEKGDAWDNEEQIARQYINNMGAIYESGENWGVFKQGIFEAAMQNTETVVQPRSSNTWGPLSLDHVYEFMGGLNLAVRNVTGNDPTAYFNDFRNVNRPKMQELKEAIGVETNSTVFNPKYVKELLKGEASAMSTFAETFRNTYGWNVMKPAAIDDYIWNNYYEVFVKDKWKLNVRQRFEEENPYALQEMTSVMLETARKGYWDATNEQLKVLAQTHAELIRDYKAGCSGFVCDNAKLKDFIAKKLSPEEASAYKNAISSIRNVAFDSDQKNVVLKKSEEQKRSSKNEKGQEKDSYTWMIILGCVLLLGIFFVVKSRSYK
ncbi:cobaltochelatase subunit CobN [Puteibacter caeruleilacunae]|nr:cobaltochelatase subunit CobN [Puteibacter caeruleilacunae]